MKENSHYMIECLAFCLSWEHYAVCNNYSAANIGWACGSLPAATFILIPPGQMHLITLKISARLNKLINITAVLTKLKAWDGFNGSTQKTTGIKTTVLRPTGTRSYCWHLRLMASDG